MIEVNLENFLGAVGFGHSNRTAVGLSKLDLVEKEAALNLAREGALLEFGTVYNCSRKWIKHCAIVFLVVNGTELRFFQLLLRNASENVKVFIGLNFLVFKPVLKAIVILFDLCDVIFIK